MLDIELEVIERAQSLLEEFGFDSWLIVTRENEDVHSRFVLGIRVYSTHAIIVPKEGDVKVLITRMEGAMVRDRGFVVEEYGGEKKFTEKLKEMISDLGETPKIVINYVENSIIEGKGGFDKMPVGIFTSLKTILENVSLESAAPFLEKLRSVKTPKEIKKIEEAVKATIEIFENKVPEFIKEGVTEKEVGAKINYEIDKVGEPSFETIVASGLNSAYPHHQTSKKKIVKGDIVLIDMGVKLDGYCGDITRTYQLGRKDGEKLEQMYEAVYNAKKEAIEILKPGIMGMEVDKIAREVLKKHGFDADKFFIHALGHPLGIETHDVGARLSNEGDPYAKIPIPAGSVLTVEPGLYIEGVGGIRLEDNVVITREKCRPLSYSPRELIHL
ncbi:MAG: M24 family metallopeptidase [Candidatus Hodarchaeota archaeon]